MSILKLCAICLSILLFFAFTGNTSKPDFVSIEDLTSANLIRTKVTGIGGYSENCVQFEIENLTTNTQRIWIEPGRRLVSKDSALQDIFIVKSIEILLAANETTTITGYGFCCQSSNGGPPKGAKFSLGYMAPKEWVTLAQLIDINEFPSGAVQSAIWSISNNHQTASITSSNPDEVRPLRTLVAQLKNEPIPWYYLTYKQDTGTVFSGKPEHLSGSFNYELTSNTIISIHITNNNGQLVKVLAKDIPKQKGKYELLLNQTVTGWPNGKYYVRIYQGNHSLNTKMEFRI